MSKRLFTYLVTGLVALALLPTAAWGVCVVTVVASMGPYGVAPGTGGDPVPPTAAQASGIIRPVAAAAGGLILNQEGRTERVSDVLVADNGVAPNCFGSTSQSIRLTYNATLTSPTSISSATTANFDVFDSAGSAGLVILASSTVGLAPGGTPQTVITVTVQQAGTAGDPTAGAGSAFRIKNLRVDSTPLTVAAPGNTATATVSASTAGTLATATFTVGTALKTISSTTAPTLTLGTGTQSANGPLGTQATFSFTENFSKSLRQPGTACTTGAGCVSGVANDIATNATSVIFDSGTTIPSGVTVTWPATISNSATGGTIVAPAVAAPGYILTSRTGANVVCTGGATPCFAIYDVTKSDTGIAATINTITGGTANGVTSSSLATPTIGVTIGSTSGFGTATLKASFGPGESAGSGNDDVNPTAIPRYVNTNTASATTRLIVTGNWFTINAVRTVLLYPFASTTGGFNTGISVANTCSDKAAFAATNDTCTQTGPLTFYFFPTGGTAFSLSSDLTGSGTALPNCRGLNASGALAPGGVFACGLTSLLTAAGKTSFDGYIIVVGVFNNGHGFSAQFNASGAPFAANNALVLNPAGRTSGFEFLGE